MNTEMRQTIVERHMKESKLNLATALVELEERCIHLANEVTKLNQAMSYIAENWDADAPKIVLPNAEDLIKYSK